MRDVDHRIAEWRRTLIETGRCPPDAIDELESHLREEYDRLVRAGEQPERALEQAIARLGTPEALGAEFAKNGTRVVWAPVRVAMVLFVIAAVVLPVWLTYRVHDRQFGLLLAAHIASVTLGYGAALLLGGVATCYVMRRLFRELSTEQGQSITLAARRLTRWATILTATGIILGMAWMGAKGETMWSWDPREIGASLVVLWGLMAIIWSGPRGNVRPIMLTALLGSAVVLAGWFGPHLNAVLVVMATLVPLAMFAVGLMPRECLRRRNV